MLPDTTKPGWLARLFFFVELVQSVLFRRTNQNVNNL